MFKLFILFLLFDIGFGDCQNGGIEWQSQCYTFQTLKSAFINAEEACVSIGGHLASIHDAFANAFLAQQATLTFHDSVTTDIWIGATSLIHRGTWSWTDGTYFDFNELSDSRPYNGSFCLSLSIIDGRWLIEDCFKIKNFVCKMPATPPPQPFYNCSLGWIYFQPTHSCYSISKLAKWKDTSLDCQNNGGKLASIHSDEETYFAYTMTKILQDHSIWIGMYSIDNERTWVWVDGTTVDYYKWDIGSPSRNLPSCVSIDHRYGGFHDDDCGSQGYGLCKQNIL
uniref:C-type lectin domain-containing protein n=1 Tax=Panagrolaimus superbus TaxID=310955 RepID=A0A914YG15_9BILA